MTNMITEKSVAVAITLALLLSVAVYYHAILPVGLLQHIDEYSTLDRVAGLLRTGDWLTVYSLNQPTFNKPPLQYWASAAVSWNSADIEYAHRLPSWRKAL